MTHLVSNRQFWSVDRRLANSFRRFDQRAPEQLRLARLALCSRRVRLWARWGAYCGAMWGAIFGAISLSAASFGVRFDVFGSYILQNAVEGAIWVAFTSGCVAGVMRYQTLQHQK